VGRAGKPRVNVLVLDEYQHEVARSVGEPRDAVTLSSATMDGFEPRVARVEVDALFEVGDHECDV
jgi:hypothetical protein